MTATPQYVVEPGEDTLASRAAEHLWMHFTRMSSYTQGHVPVMVRGCVAKEFAAFATNADRPVAHFLRALARDLNEQTPGKGVGVIGQCFTGGFALAAAVDVTMHRIAVLTGQTPGALVARLDQAQALPALPGAVDAGTPGEILRRRPDVIAAEQRLHAATARIGVATADLFPRFTLGGLVGTQAIESRALFSRDSETRLIALGVDEFHFYTMNRSALVASVLDRVGLRPEQDVERARAEGAAA